MLKSFSDRLVFEECFNIIMNGLHTSDNVFFNPTCDQVILRSIFIKAAGI